MRALIVEDEVRLAHNIASFLRERANLAVDVSSDGEDGLHMASTNPYDVVILDLMLPKLDGWTILKRLREGGHDVPVLILTARDATEDVIRGLEEGGDDYLTKPFEMPELAARCKALIRRGHGRAAPVLRVGPLEVHTSARRVTLHGGPVAMHAMEYRLLEYLAMRAGQIVTRSEILEHLYDFDAERFSNVIEVYISSLRRKLDPGPRHQLIHTIRGAGYKLEGAPP
jgi:two-component system, OmpR family, response regulator